MVALYLLLETWLLTNVPADGAGLAAGVFHHLLDRGAESPKVLAATHFHGKLSRGCL